MLQGTRKKKNVFLFIKDFVIISLYDTRPNAYFMHSTFTWKGGIIGYEIYEYMKVNKLCFCSEQKGRDIAKQ